ATRARQHRAADADLEAARRRTRRAGDAHGLPDHSAPRRLRIDQAGTFAARASEQSRAVGAAESLGDRSRPAAFRRCGAPRVSCTRLARWRERQPIRMATTFPAYGEPAQENVTINSTTMIDHMLPRHRAQ